MIIVGVLGDSTYGEEKGDGKHLVVVVVGAIRLLLLLKPVWTTYSFSNTARDDILVRDKIDCSYE